MIAKLAGVAIDARWSMPRRTDLAARVRAAHWIAANALAAGGVQVSIEGALPRGPRVFALHARGFAGALAALAALPALIDPTTLPPSWWVLLRAIGLPWLDGSAAAAVAGGASVLTCGDGSCDVSVEQDPEGYRVHVGTPGRMLVM